MTCNLSVGWHMPPLALLVVVGLVAFFLLLPCAYDPAIRFKEWLTRKDER